MYNRFHRHLRCKLWEDDGKMNGNTQTTFTVTGVSGTLPYQSGDNHDEDDADASDGTSITVTNP